MVFGNIRNSKIFVFLVFFLSINLINGFKPDKKDSKENQMNPRKNKDLSNYDKVCKIEDKCRECTFEELKNVAECQINGYKEIKHCVFYESKKIIDESFMTDTCNDNIRINPVYYFLFIFIILAGISFYVRKRYKSFMIQSILQKLSIIKDK